MARSLRLYQTDRFLALHFRPTLNGFISVLTKDGKNLFVAYANDNSVSIIDVAQRKVIEMLNAALFPNAPTGSASNGLALSADEKTLYIANANNNCLRCLM